MAEVKKMILKAEARYKSERDEMVKAMNEALLVLDTVKHPRSNSGNTLLGYDSDYIKYMAVPIAELLLRLKGEI